jgi:hypothetical protein
MSGQRCRQVAGFILQQECKEQADAFCNECSKPVCSDHSRVVGERILCLDCTKFALERDRNAIISSRSPGYYYDDDPYFYSFRTYPSYSYGSEFDESDRAGLESQKEGTGEFEQDFGGS